MRNLTTLALTAAAILFSTGLISAQTTADTNDFQVWTETTVVVPVIKETDENNKTSTKLSVFFNGVLRFGQNRLAFIDERIGAGFNWQIRKGLTYSSSYLYRSAEAIRGKKDFEHVIRFDLSAEKKWKSFSLKDRNRVEYRFRNGKENSARYRNKITAKFPVRRDGKEVFAPFIATEPFIEFSDGKLSSNELSLGISKKFEHGLSADIFYINKYNRTSLPKYINGVGVSLTVTLP
jgi:hypothetical protein